MEVFRRLRSIKAIRSWQLIALLLVAYFIVIRFTFWQAVQSTNTDSAAKNFAAATSVKLDELSGRFENYANILYSGRALFNTDSTVSRQGWSTFVESQETQARYPAVYALAYVTAVNRQGASDLIARLNAQRLNTETKPIAVYPATSDDNLAIVTYVAPASADQATLGFNMLSSNVRSANLNAARDTGIAEASQPLTLLPDSRSAATSILFTLGVYDTAHRADTVAERQAATRGYVVMGVHVKPLLDSIFNAPGTDRNIGVIVSTANQTIYQSGPHATKDGLRNVTGVTIGGQHWQVEFDGPSSYGLNATASLAPTLMFLSSLPLLLLLALAFYYARYADTVQRHQQTPTKP